MRHVNVFAEFAKSVRRQIDENKDFQKNVKLLNDKTNELAESEAVARAKKAVSETSKGTSKVVETVSKVVDSTLQTPAAQVTGKVIYKTAEAVANASTKIAEPIMDTTAAKAISSGIKEVVDSSANAFYAEYKPKEIRQKEQQERLKRIRAQSRLGATDPTKPCLPDPEAGANVVLHRSSRINEAWRKFKEESSIGKGIFSFRRSIEESDSPFMERLRQLVMTTKVEESEHARVIRAIKQIDPLFSTDAFLKEATQYTIPEIMESYLKCESDVLKQWCSEAAYAKLTYGFEAQRSKGLVSDSKLLDIRDVDIRQLTMLNDELPIILVGFMTQEILLFRNVKGEIEIGSEDHIQAASYVIAFSKSQLLDPEAPVDPVTGGWVVVDWSRGAMW